MSSLNLSSLRIFTALALVLCASTVQAQSNSLFGNSSPIGQSGLGTSSSLGGASGGMSRSGTGLGGGGAGSAIGGGLGTPLNIGGNSQFGAGGMGLSTSGVVGMQNNGFVGNTRANATTGQAGRGAQAGLTGRAGQGGSVTQGSNPFADLLRAAGGQQGQQTPPAGKLRPQLRVGFNYAPRPSATVDKSLNQIFRRPEPQVYDRIARIPSFKTVTVVPPVNGIVILRGSVASEDDSKLAAQIVRMEPGVRQVQNEIKVQSP